MKITILCSDISHPVNAYLEGWKAKNDSIYLIELIQKKNEAKGGDILFLVSCSEIITSSERSLYKSCLVLHSSDLPKGRGWSPHIWEISQGENTITLSLLEAVDGIDSGDIWKKLNIPIPKDALWDEINHLLFSAEISLIDYAVENFNSIIPQAQSEKIKPTYYPRRTNKDSCINPKLSIAEQFNLIRVCDPYRYPAHFEYQGYHYSLIINKID